jgi:hypothetical protein
MVACGEKRRLMMVYHIATDDFAEIVRKLWKEIDVLSRDEYLEWAESVQQARMECESARFAFERHVSVHQC